MTTVKKIQLNRSYILLQNCTIKCNPDSGVSWTTQGTYLRKISYYSKLTRVLIFLDYYLIDDIPIIYKNYLIIL